MKSIFGLLLMICLLSCIDESSKSSNPRPKLSKDSLFRPEANPYAIVDVSPMDMAYLPVDYPKLKIKPTVPVARVIYSRPLKQGRKVFGGLQKFGEPWRLGANEATEIELFKPVIINNTTIAKGRYVLYSIPYEDKWTIVFNTNLDSWGLELDSTKDLHRFDITATRKNMSIEYFSMVFQPSAGGADLVMAWDDVEARLPLQYSDK
ncbi:MAG: DUF2911 domain-containing protein [Flavisolibacter sp.]